MTNPGNFNPEIHSTDFRKPFEAYRVGRNELVPIDGRKMESLNGKWHFLADPLEYMLRGSWYKEEKYDEAGREKPQDYDFDSYPKMKVPSCWNMERFRRPDGPVPASIDRSFRGNLFFLPRSALTDFS